MENLFENLNSAKKPLAERVRPTTLSEFVGQSHLVGKGKLLNRLISTQNVGNSIFWGPPGCGKTTLAYVIANVCKGKFEKLNAVSDGVGEAKKIIEQAKKDFELFGIKTYLLLDECHRWSKAQSDSVLGAIEQGYLILIGSTTENPNYSMTRAIVSRCTVFEFKSLDYKDILVGLKNALQNEKGLKNYNVKIDEDALLYIAKNSAGDLRIALKALELAALTCKKNKKGEIEIKLDDAKECLQTPAISLNEDLKFDLLSAFCKSLRGSDATAALYYANRLIEAGVEPQLLARRTIAHASEDVGLSAPNALLQANAALYALDHLGLPEGNLALTQAIIYVCESPKDNRVVVAMNMAQDDARNHADDNIPPYLKNHTKDSKKYKYPHDFGGYVEQQYLPDSLKNRKYFKRK